MTLFKGAESLPAPLANAVVTIGNFDGVHLGHQELLGRVRARSREAGGPAVVFTFRPHPHFVLRPGEAPPLLNSYEEKLELLERYGAEIVVEEPFSRDFSRLSPEKFVGDVLRRKLGARHLVLGYDFAFGHARSGSSATIRSICDELGIGVEILPPLELGGSPVSSSRIRRHLAAGELEQANACLGRAFFLRGRVVRGEGRGSGIGVPTANLEAGERKLPRNGVYLTRTEWRGRRYGSVTNIGVNPTFHGGAGHPKKIETHVLDLHADLYGDGIQVEFLERMRDERKFSGLEELLAAIRADIVRARERLAQVAPGVGDSSGQGPG